jgi:hypothetical protein
MVGTAVATEVYIAKTRRNNNLRGRGVALACAMFVAVMSSWVNQLHV